MHRPTNPSTLRLKIHWCNNNKLLYYHPIINLSLDQSLTPNLTLDLSAGETIYGTAQFLGKFSPYFSPHFCLLGETHLVRPVQVLIATTLSPYRLLIKKISCDKLHPLTPQIDLVKAPT